MKRFRSRLAFPVLCLAVGLAVFGVSYTLLGQGPSEDKTSKPEAPEDKNELFRAVVSGDLEELKTALIDGADPNKANSQGLTALHWVVLGADRIPVAYQQVKVLLDYGADPNIQNNHGATPLHSAALHSSGPIMAALLGAGGDPLKKTAKLFAPDELCSPYEWALQANNEGAVAAIEEVTDYQPANIKELRARGVFFQRAKIAFAKDTPAEKRTALLSAIEGYKEDGFLEEGEDEILRQQAEALLNQQSQEEEEEEE